MKKKSFAVLGLGKYGSSLAGGYGDFHIAFIPVTGLPIGFIIPVPASGKAFPAGSGIEFAGGSDISRCFRPGSGTQQSNPQDNQGGCPFPNPV